MKKYLLGRPEIRDKEKHLQEKVIKAVKELYGENVWIYKTHDQCRVGIPDLILCFFGHFVAIELKRPIRSAERKGEMSHQHTDADLTPLQKYNIAQINRAQGSAWSGRYFNEIMARLDKLYQIHIEFGGKK